MNRKFTCIVCPNGCEIEVEYEGKDVKNIEGEGCRKGREYVVQELTDPRRNIASSVILLNGELPLVSVRLTNPIPKDKIFGYNQKYKTKSSSRSRRYSCEKYNGL